MVASVDGKKFLSIFSWNAPIVSQLKIASDLNVSHGPTNEMKTRGLVENTLLKVLVKVSCTPCTTQKSYPNSWFLTYIGEMNSPKATKENQKNHKGWDINTIKDLEKFAPNTSTNFFLDCCRQKNFYLN